VEEIEEHIKSGKPAMLYFSTAPVVPDSVDAAQYAALKAFKDSCKSRSLYETYSGINEFKDKFYRQLQLKLNQDSYFVKRSSTTADRTSPVSSVPDVPALSREAQNLLKEAVQDPRGRLVRILSLDGIVIDTNKKRLTENGNPRSGAMWEGALQELHQSGLIIDRGSGEVFHVTRKGYDIANLLESGLNVH
jgi:hypothetical protein